VNVTYIFLSSWLSCVPKIIKFGGNLMKFCQKKLGDFLAHPVVANQRFMTKDTTNMSSKLSFFLHPKPLSENLSEIRPNL